MSNTPIFANAAPLKPEAFIPLPLGCIRPGGWLKDQLRVQADGLGGLLEEIWPDVGPDSAWLGGSGEGWERGPYYLDGLVPLAYLLDDGRLKKMARKWIEWTLTHQQPSGWISPCNVDDKIRHDVWPTAIMLKALTQYHEVTDDPRVIDVMTKLCNCLLKHLDEHPLYSWGSFRWQDLAISIQWLYNRTRDKALLELMAKAQKQGYDWKGHFHDFKHTVKIRREDHELRTHVVNNAMAVKAGGVAYAQTGDESDKQSAYQTLRMLDEYHGTVFGGFTGDEHYAGRSPVQGTELCAVVEEMFSLETLLSVFGDPAFGDRLELIAYNALPATFKPDMWAHQYDQQVNQVLVSNALRDWVNNGNDANLYGLQPNFGCCTANMHQGWPKLVKHLWMATHDGGLAAVTYGPCEVTAPVAGGRKVTISTETLYPFGDRIRMTIRGAGGQAFPLALRIPAWTRKATVNVGGMISPAPAGTFLTLNRAWNDGDVVELHLPMEIRVETRYNGAAAVVRGPLVYSLKIGEKWNLLAGQPPHGDWEVVPTTDWNYGLLADESLPGASFAVKEAGKVSRVPFDPEHAPVTIKAKGRLIRGWTLEHNSAAPPPQSPVASAEPLEELTLIPYGSTNLRVTEFPRLEE